MVKYTTLEELKSALCIKDVSNEAALNNLFRDIADSLFNHFVIKKENELYRIVEIEFYHNLTDPKPQKSITYARTAPAGAWFFHYSGFDITMESNKETIFGGILIRSIKSRESFICGPMRTFFHLFNVFDLSGKPQMLPSLESVDDLPEVKFAATTRQGITISNKEFRYAWLKDFWEKPSGYTAYPWSDIKQQ